MFVISRKRRSGQIKGATFMFSHCDLFRQAYLERCLNVTHFSQFTYSYPRAWQNKTKHSSFHPALNINWQTLYFRSVSSGLGAYTWLSVSLKELLNSYGSVWLFPFLSFVYLCLLTVVMVLTILLFLATCVLHNKYQQLSLGCFQQCRYRRLKAALPGDFPWLVW